MRNIEAMDLEVLVEDSLKEDSSIGQNKAKPCNVDLGAEDNVVVDGFQHF